MPTFHRLLAGAALLLMVHAPARAQLVPGGEASNVRAHRLAYLAEVYGNVERAVEGWTRAWEADDVRRLMALYTEDAAFFPTRGEPSQGRPAVQQRLARLLPVAAGLRTTFVDFTASGDLAVYTARFAYLVHPPGEEPRSESGTLLLVLQHTDRGWRVRSHLEQAPADAADARGGGSTAAPREERTPDP